MKGSAMPLTWRPMEAVVFAVAWVRAGLSARPQRLPSSKPHRRMQKNQSESPVVTHGAEAPPSLAQLTADIISASVSTRFTPPGM